MDKALQMIVDALRPIIRRRRDIKRIKLYVCPSSRIASFEYVDTEYGRLLIEPNGFLAKGESYLLEDAGTGVGRSFAWVSRRQTNHSGG